MDLVNINIMYMSNYVNISFYVIFVLDSSGICCSKQYKKVNNLFEILFYSYYIMNCVFNIEIATLISFLMSIHY